MHRVTLAASLALMLTAGTASAACFGSGAFQNCTDGAGNNYTVNRFGNTTIMNGSNARTGSTWSQQSNSFGNTTTHSGTASDGGSWNLMEQRAGSSRFITGTDSNGNSVNRTCGIYGCN